MKAFAFQQYGSELQEVEIPEPELKPHEVLVRIVAAGVNHIDEKIRRGDLRRVEHFVLPMVLGAEFSGEVVAVGELVREFKPGMQVFAMADLKRTGGFAEYAAIDQRLLAPIPASLNTINAAALPLAGLTAWQALVDIGQLHAGQKVLIHGGTGGIGSIAIQLAKHLGARVTTTVGSTNVRLAHELGADTVINYSSEDFVQKVQGIDLVLDTQGGITLQKSLQVVRPGGKVVSLVSPQDPIYAAQVEAGMVTRARIRVGSSGVRRRARHAGADYRFLFTRPDAEQLRALAELVDEGKIRPVIDRVLPFDETPQAIQTLLGGGLRGKVLVRRR
ncbi:Phthiocerol synthesis polyketide synthase type I PpsC [Corynebacterium occultum]|uniref:Phthiocerol synthesis polyketide synthase type I PpsC n=1 Tax=Corynebacterium occultum TaxID=2675219 RepID=A0A6B8VXH2_9CORY|nr:NADP-dependent oxidoreductase [Corynebacterium occultum]QGU06044.1 Phthiocerol synthesis polyketide synthase type I PpsC [Corynebacterium occultum]